MKINRIGNYVSIFLKLIYFTGTIWYRKSNHIRYQIKIMSWSPPLLLKTNIYVSARSFREMWSDLMTTVYDLKLNLIDLKICDGLNVEEIIKLNLEIHPSTRIREISTLSRVNWSFTIWNLLSKEKSREFIL